MFLHKLPCQVVRLFNCEDEDSSDDFDSDEIDVSKYPDYYDALYYPRFHHSTFASVDGVKTWLKQCFSTYASWELVRVSYSNNFFIVENPLTNLRVTLTKEELASPGFHPRRPFKNIGACNPAWLYTGEDQLVNAFEGISVKTIRSCISVSREKRRRDEVIAAVAAKFTSLAREIAVLSDEDLRIWLSKETTFRLSGDRRADVFHIFQHRISERLFPAVVRPQYGNVYLGGGPCVLNPVIGGVDPELDLKTFTTRVRRLPLSRLKTYLLHIHYSRRKCFPCAPRDDMIDALRSSMLERWNELVHLTPQVVGEILNCYVAEVDYSSVLLPCDVMDWEFGRDLCGIVLPPMRIRKIVERRRNVRVVARTEAAASVTEHFDQIEREWPQPVSLDTKLESCRKFRDAMKWKRSRTCAVCARELRGGDALKTSVFAESDLAAVCEELNFSLLKVSQHDRGVVPIEHPLLKDYMLDSGGWVDNQLVVCVECENRLKENKLPKYSLRNMMFRGTLPEEFRDLTWVEEMVCAVYRCTVQMTRLYGSSDPSQPRLFKGNTCAHDLNIISTATVLPRTPADVNGMLGVVFVGPKRSVKSCLGTIYKIRKEKVWRFLCWLSENNPLYESVKLSKAHLDMYGDNEVVPGLEARVIVHEPTEKEAEAMFEEETAGFEQHYASEALEDARINGQEMTLLERMGVSDVESVKVQGRTFTAAALRNLVVNPSKKPDLAIFCGEDPVNEYNNPNLIMGMYPTLFPYGIGGFEDPTRSVPISFQKQANYYLDIASRVFRYHSSFLFVAMNIFQRRQVHLHTHFAVNSANFDSVARELSGLRAETLAEVAKHLEQEGRVESLTIEQKRVFILLNQVKTIAAKVTGSEATKITFRNEIRSYVGPFGVPHLFFTANPNPSNSPLFQIMWGDETINLDEKTPTLVEYAKRGMRLAEDPVAALDFFNFTVRCMMEHLFGWDFEKKRSSKEGGLLGHIRCFYGTKELTGRGNYHMHFLITLHGSLNPEDVHRKLAESEEFKERFFSFFEDIIRHDLPMDMPFDAKANPKAETSPIIPGPDATDEELERFMRIFEQDVKSCGEKLQRHTHKAVCNKYDHDTCRFQFPREFVSESYFDPEMKAVVLACRDQMVNYYNEWVLVFCRFNHDLRCILSGKSCKAAMFYITDYITKMTVKTYEMLSLMSTAVMRAHATMPEGDPNMSVRNMIHKCLTQYGKQQQVHAQQAAGVLRGQREMFSSHKTVPMLSGAMMQYVKAHWPWKTDTDDPDDVVEDPYVTMRLNGRGELSRRCQFTEYLHRSLDLADVSFYEFVRRFRVERKESLKEERLSTFTTGDFITKLPRYSFVPEFELYGTHHIVEHTNESEAVHFTKTVPRIIGHKLPRANDPCYAAFMLGHFKPFHKDIPLVDFGLDIADTFRRHPFSALGQRCMKNWEAMHECEDERDADRLRKRAQMFKSSQLLTNAYNGQGIDDLVELPDFTLATAKRDAKAQFQLMKLAESNWFAPVGVGGQSEVHPLLKDLVITSLMRDRWNQQVKQLEGAIAASRVNAAGKDQVAAPAKETASTFESMDTTDNQLSREREDPGVKHTIGSEKHEKRSTADLLQRTVDKFKLNPEQETAFRIMAGVFLKRMELGDVEDDGGAEPFPLRMFLTGPGGTGKTYVIKALVDVMESFGYAHAVRFIAPTGSAAAINDGLTIHTAFKIRICDKVSKHNSRSIEGKETYEATLSQSTRQHLREAFKDVQVLVIDEVSLLEQELLPEIDAGCRYAKERHNWWFGGMMVIFCGDLYQFPPVGGSPVYSPIIPHSAVDDRNLKRRLGRLAWESINEVVFLHRQQRMESDPEFGAAVQRLRTRTCTDADVQLFNRRVVRSEDVPDGIDMKGVDSVAVVRTNLLRHAINSYKAMADCTERELLTCAAVDKVRGLIVPAEMRDKLLNRDTTSLQHKGALPGYLSFYIGMPVILRSRNISTDLKVTNGARGVLRHLQTGIDAHGKRYGQCAIVEFVGGDFQLDRLPPRCFPIVPTTWTFHEKMKNENGELVTVHVRREQLPFQPGFACTGHVAQGQTMKSVLAYLHEGGFAAYVAASRATSQKGIYLAEKVKIGHLTKDLPPALVDEMARFEQMAQSTLQKYQLDPKLFQATASTAHKPYGIDFDKPTSVQNKTKRKKASVADLIGPATPSKKVRVKGPQVSSPAASTFGNKWDSLNWSCAYDSFFTSLYHVYTERNQVWRRQMCTGLMSRACCGLFEQVPAPTLQHDSSYLDEARDIFRDMLFNRDPVSFPRIGSAMASVIDILDCFMDSEAYDVMPILRCSSGCQIAMTSCKTRYNSACAPLSWCGAGLAEQNAGAASCQAWIDCNLRYYGFLSSPHGQIVQQTLMTHGLSCRGRSEVSVVFVNPPPLLSLQIYPEYGATTDITSTVSLPMNGVMMRYRLCSVIYYTGNHFLSRVFMRAGAFDHDGQIEHGKLRPVSGEISYNRLNSGKAHVALYVPT